MDKLQVGAAQRTLDTLRKSDLEDLDDHDQDDRTDRVITTNNEAELKDAAPMTSVLELLRKEMEALNFYY